MISELRNWLKAPYALGMLAMWTGFVELSEGLLSYLLYYWDIAIDLGTLGLSSILFDILKFVLAYVLFRALVEFTHMLRTYRKILQEAYEKLEEGSL